MARAKTTLHSVMCDWLRDRFSAKPLRHLGQAVYVRRGQQCWAHSATVSHKRKWYES